MDNDEHLHKAFSHFDLDGNGFIDFDELKEALKEELSMEGAELINDIMNEVDIDKVSTSISFMFKGKTFRRNTPSNLLVVDSICTVPKITLVSLRIFYILRYLYFSRLIESENCFLPFQGWTNQL